MFIIFDLDDTLIQTSKLITPWKFHQVLQDLATQGYLEELEAHFAHLLATYNRYATSKEAIHHFFKAEQLSQALLPRAVKILGEPDEALPVCVFPGVYEMLKTLKNRYKLILVTAGSRPFQEFKIKKAGLDKGYFDHIEIAESMDKFLHYQSAILNFSLSSGFVVGDRVEKDLHPAKKLGLKTILVRQGRGAFQKNDPAIVDFVIQDVVEVQNVLKSF